MRYLEVVGHIFVTLFVACGMGTAHDYVLDDAPPVLRCADAVLASAHADGVVLIARTGITARDALVRAREQIERAHGTVLGAVLQDGRRPHARRRSMSITN